jgi:YbbR domain-containing protein
MNENLKKQNFLLYFMIGFFVGFILWLNVYAKGEQRTYDTYHIATIREQALREIPITVLDSRIGS